MTGAVVGVVVLAFLVVPVTAGALLNVFPVDVPLLAVPPRTPGSPSWC
ncbi:hypothetical protein ACQP2K_26785 [Microbispora siamensis]